MVKIFVGNLGQGSDENELRAAFEQFGTVSECSIISNYGFVHMDKDDDANKAIQSLNGTEFAGTNISVEMSTGGKRGGRGGSSYGGRGRGGPRGGPRGYGGPRGGGNFNGGPPSYGGGGGGRGYGAPRGGGGRGYGAPPPRGGPRGGPPPMRGRGGRGGGMAMDPYAAQQAAPDLYGNGYTDDGYGGSYAHADQGYSYDTYGGSYGAYGEMGSSYAAAPPPGPMRGGRGGGAPPPVSYGADQGYGGGYDAYGGDMGGYGGDMSYGYGDSYGAGYDQGYAAPAPAPAQRYHPYGGGGSRPPRRYF